MLVAGNPLPAGWLVNVVNPNAAPFSLKLWAICAGTAP